MSYVTRITKIHTSVRRAAQEASVPHHEYIDKKKENMIFTHMLLCDLSDWNLICRKVPPRQGNLQTKFEENCPR